jgi:hypothetical protein
MSFVKLLLIIYHHHWLDSPTWVLVISEASARYRSVYCFFIFHYKSLLQGGVVSPTPNPRLSWRADVFYQGCLPYLNSSSFKAPGSRFLPLHDLAV